MCQNFVPLQLVHLCEAFPNSFDVPYRAVDHQFYKLDELLEFQVMILQEFSFSFPSPQKAKRVPRACRLDLADSFYP